uniref:Uncharacterized protein n=1 Tax=Trichuris muris TaxID=70415 RepID=A0A5S6QB13_TRIMR
MNAVESTVVSTESVTGALKRELCQENPVYETIQQRREQLVQLLSQGERLKTLRSSSISKKDWEQFAKLGHEQVTAADAFLQRNYPLSVSSAGGHSSSLGTQAGSGWESEEKDAKRHVQLTLAAMESSDFSVPLERNRLKLRIQHAGKTAVALRRRIDGTELDEEIRKDWRPKCHQAGRLRDGRRPKAL